MDDAQVIEKPKRAYRRRSDNGQDGIAQTGAEPNTSPEVPGIAGKPLLNWAEFDKWMYKWEFDNKTKRITLIWSNLEDAPYHYSGCYSECNVHHGEPAIRLSTGEILKV